MVAADPRPPLIARYTWMRQWPAAILEGASQGIVNLAFFAVRRTLGSPEWIVPLLIGLWQLPWIFAPGVGTILAQSDPQRLWRRLALLAYFPVLCVVFVWVEPAGEPGHGTGNLLLFLVLMSLFYGVGVAIVPHRGAMLRTNYPLGTRGRMFGLVTTTTILSGAVAMKLGGLLLDSDPRWLRVLFPLAGLLGMAGLWRLSRIRWRNQRRSGPFKALAERPLAAMRRAWRETFRILREDRAFLAYEAGFMLYGFGFLTSIGLIVLYAEGELGLSYDQWTYAQGLAFPFMQILAASPMGRLSDRLGIVRTTALGFGVLALFFAAMPFVGSAAGLVAAYAVFGVGMAGVMVGWSLGPLHFAPDGQAHMYAAIHFSMVGLRSVTAPFLGYGVKTLLSFRAAFGLSVLFELAALAVILRLARRSR